MTAIVEQRWYLPQAVPREMLLPGQNTTRAFERTAQYQISALRIVGQLLERMMSLASPERSERRVDLQPSTYLPLLMTKESLLLMFQAPTFFAITINQYIKIITSFILVPYNQQAMGSDASSNAETDDMSKYATTKYQIDLRMIDQITLLPSAFNYTMQKIIQEIEGLCDQEAEHPLQKYIIYHLNIRFSRLNVINQEAFRAEKSFLEILSADNSRFSSQKWTELLQKSSFQKLLRSLQKQHDIEMLIKEQYEYEDNTADKVMQKKSRVERFETFRKPIIGKNGADATLDEHLLSRLFYSFYLRIIKNNANTEQKQIILQFHQMTGRILCLLISFNFLLLEDLFQLVYKIVYIDKHPDQIKVQLSAIHTKYYPLCLQNKYTITVDSNKLEKIKDTVSFYLNALYASSTREAEDPQILPAEDSLMPIRSFPVSKISKDARQRA